MPDQPEPTRLTTAQLETARSWALDWQRQRRVPGMALVVTDRSHTLLTEMSGIADRGGMRPVTDEQRWQIGSISKAFTSIALLQLQSQGALSVDDPVVDHLPWAVHLHRGLTLHHLMTHTGGLSNGSEWTPDSLLESAVQGAVGSAQPPGHRFHYSNPGYELLGDVVEAVTGQPLETYLEQHVLWPLGMGASAGSIRADDRDRDVRGHRPPRDDVLWRGDAEQVPDAFFPSCTADGAIVATPDDVAVYLRFLLLGAADGVLDSDGFTLLSGQHVEARDGWYGYGLETQVVGGRVILGHSGGMVGMFADVRVDRERGIGTALLVNGFCDVWEANRVLLQRLAGLDAAEPPWPPPELTEDAVAEAPHSACVGLFRSYNPWMPTLRVLDSGGMLNLVDPVTGEGTTLHPESATRFHVNHPDSPDTVDFDVEVGGRYQRLELSGCVYGRVRRER